MADITKNVESSLEAAQGIETGLSQMKAAQQATHDLNAANRAAQEEAGIAAQMQPINQTVDFLNLYNQRQAAEYAKEKREEEKRLGRERLGHDIASIAASVGDMVRASEGAPVNQRDWQRIYDNLTAQEKANVDNYRVRMAKLHEDEKAARMAQAQAKAKAVGDAQKRQYDMDKLLLELGWKGDEASKGRAKDILLKMLEGQSRVEAANARSSSSGSGIKPIRFSYNGKTVDVIGGKSFENMMNRILSVLNDKSNTKPNVIYNRVTFKPKEIQTDPQGFYNRRIIDLLSPSKFSNYTEDAQSEIDKIVEDYLYKEGNGGNNGEFRDWF